MGNDVLENSINTAPERGASMQESAREYMAPGGNSLLDSFTGLFNMITNPGGGGGQQPQQQAPVQQQQQQQQDPGDTEWWLSKHGEYIPIDKVEPHLLKQSDKIAGMTPESINLLEEYGMKIEASGKRLSKDENDAHNRNLAQNIPQQWSPSAPPQEQQQQAPQDDGLMGLLGKAGEEGGIKNIWDVIGLPLQTQSQELARPSAQGDMTRRVMYNTMGSVGAVDPRAMLPNGGRSSAPPSWATGGSGAPSTQQGQPATAGVFDMINRIQPAIAGQGTTIAPQTAPRGWRRG